MCYFLIENVEKSILRLVFLNRVVTGQDGASKNGMLVVDDNWRNCSLEKAVSGR